MFKVITYTELTEKGNIKNPKAINKFKYLATRKQYEERKIYGNSTVSFSISEKKNPWECQKSFK